MSRPLQKLSDAPAIRRLGDLPGPRGWPLVGNALSLDVPRVHQQLEEWARQYGRIYRIRIGRKDVVVVSDAKVNEEMLRARPESFRRMSAVEPVLAELGGAGVFSAEGVSWRRQRRLAMEALASRHLRNFYPTLLRVAGRLRKRWLAAAAQNRVVDIDDDLMRFTVDVTTSLAFGNDMNTLENEEPIQQHLGFLFPAAGRRLFMPFPYWRYVRLPYDRRVDRAVGEIHRILEELVAESRAKLAAKPEAVREPDNFLEAMLLARDEDGKPFSDQTIFGNALTMLLAGEDTTAHTLAWMTHELLDQPRVVAAMVAEIDGVLGEAVSPPTIEIANRFHYVDAVSQETMRLRPVAAFLALEANEDVVVDDIALPRGTQTYALFRPPVLDEKNFSDAQTFRPERWMPNAPGAHNAAAQMPFGSGPRVCPGRSLSHLEMRVVVSTLLRTFEIERVGDRSGVTEEFSFTVVPKNLRMKLRVRASAPA